MKEQLGQKEAQLKKSDKKREEALAMQSEAKRDAVEQLAATEQTAAAIKRERDEATATAEEATPRRRRRARASARRRRS